MHSYTFIIPNHKVFTYQVFAYCIILINIVAAFLYQYQMSAGANTPFIAGIGIISLLVIIWDFYNYKKNNRLSSLGIVILFFGLIWFRFGLYQVFFINLLLWGLYIISRRNLFISINKEAIIYPSFPKKNIPWQAVSNIILKDDILTIDLKNNKIYQHQIEYTGDAVNEQEFNDFCSQQLHK